MQNLSTASSAWWSRLSPQTRAAALIVSGVLPVLLCCGGLTALGALVGEPESRTTDAAGGGQVVEATPTAEIEVRTVVETEEIPFGEEEVEDPSLPEGTREVRTEGVPGERQLTYEVTFVDGAEVSREIVSEEVTKEPVDQVVVVGTGEEAEAEPVSPPEPPSDPGRDPSPRQSERDRPTEEPRPRQEPAPEPEPECHPSYEGACVPFASDVDCEGGNGNGPAYVRGPLRVVGPDVYDLDRDGDGIACDRG